MNFNRLVREPLVHFLLLGALLFLLFAWLDRDEGTARDEIVVDEALVTHLASRFERSRLRRPSAAELDAVIEAWVREEILYREGLEMGMDIDDPIVRRRVAQKMEIFSETLAPYAVSEQELGAWLAENMEQYRIEPTLTFRQVYFDPDRHGDAVEDVIESARQRLEDDADAAVGETTLLPARQTSVRPSLVARSFGQAFAEAIADAESGVWFGPVRSGFGLHLVLVESREEGREPRLEEVRNAVERDLLAQRIDDSRNAFYKALRERYTVRVERRDVDGAVP